MERVNVQAKKQSNAKESIEKRSPLQDLNGVQIHKSSTINSSNPSVEAPKCLSRFLLSSSTSASSSSKTHFNTNSKTSSKLTNNASKTSTAGAPKFVARSKENKLLTKPFLHKSDPLGVHKLKSGYKNAKRTSENGPRSKFSSDEGNPISRLKKGSQYIEGKTIKSKGRVSGKPSIQLVKASDKINLNFVEKCTPVGKVACGSALDLANVVNSNKNVEEDLMMKMGNTDKVPSVRTPPIEASVSPEIQFGSHSKILVSNSGATPICYGAGHHLSGVTDKRKCRRRGSLKGGFQKATIFYDELNDGNVVSNLQDCSIPLLAGASVNWHLSPRKERRQVEGNHLGKVLEQCGIVFGSDSVTLDLLSSSPSLSICGDESDLVCDDNGNYSTRVEDGAAAIKMEDNINNILINEQFSDTTPICSSFCNSLSSGDEKLVKKIQIGNCSALLSGSFSSGNKIQTPNSDSSLDRCAGMTKMETDQRNFVQCELGSISPTPNREGPWPILNAPGFVSDFGSPPSSSMDITKLHHKNENAAISSWVSDATTLDNFGVSEMRISWRDGSLEAGVIETDEEFDCCRCLSDEDNIGGEICEELPKTVTKYGGTNENDLDVEDDDDDDISQPKVLDYEPIINLKEKEKLSSNLRDACAESICTNGGSLVASVESDWADCFSDNYFQV